MTVIEVARGDILTANTDLIVNPANSFLNHAGGLAAIIAERARHGAPGTFNHRDPTDEEAAIDAWCADQHGPLLATGAARFSRPGLLPFKGVVNAVGPIWNGGIYYERTLLIQTMRSILAVVNERGFESVAVPAISCGVFGFPVEEAAELLVRAAYASPYPNQRVRFVPFSETDAEAFGRACACVFDGTLPSLLV